MDYKSPEHFTIHPSLSIVPNMDTPTVHSVDTVNTMDTPIEDAEDAVDTVDTMDTPIVDAEDTVDTVDTPPLYEPSVDMFGIQAPPMDIFGAVDHEVLMYYLKEEERGQRDVKLDGTLLTDFMFKRHFRFSRHGFEKLLQLVAPMLIHQTRRGGGLEPHIQLQAALNHLSGLQFQRTTGLTYGASQNNARECLVRVVDALITLKEQYIYMPNVRERHQTSERMYEFRGLRGIAWGIDCTHCFFAKKPRGLPPNIHPQKFYGRKNRYSLNVQVVGNDTRICDVDCTWPGSAQDATIYHYSAVKQHIEAQQTYKCAADSGYAISQVMVKPYNTVDAYNDRRKRMFNKKLSAIRTTMTENIFGRWKTRFPIITNLTTHMELSQKIIIATAILHNIATLWNEQLPEGEEEPDQDNRDPEDPEDPEDPDVIINYALSELQIKRIGQAERDQMLREFIP